MYFTNFLKKRLNYYQPLDSNFFVNFFMNLSTQHFSILNCNEIIFFAYVYFCLIFNSMSLIIFQLSMIYIINYYINLFDFDNFLLDFFLKYIDFFELIDLVKADLNCNYRNIKWNDFYFKQFDPSKAIINIICYFRIMLNFGWY